MADDALVRSSCYAAAAEAAKRAGVSLSEADIRSAFTAARKARDKIVASGDITNIGPRLVEIAQQQAEQARIAAALQRRHAALNILVRDRLDQSITALKDAGLSPRQALLAVMEGSQKGVPGARNSVAARSLAYEARYVGGMMSEIQRDRPHLINTLSDKRLSDDVFREMGELREGGSPGRTGNEDAKYLAGVFAKYAEMTRTELNGFGASIGKLDGWSGPQVHDDLKMISSGKEAWVDAILPRLDTERSFPDATSMAEVKAILGDTYDTITTGVPNKVTPREKGQRVNPANLAKSLGKSRVLHFRDAEAATSYRDEFGYGNSIYGVMASQRRAAQVAATMDAFGPNPEIMFGSLVDAERRKIRDNATLSPKEKQKQLDGLNAQSGSLRGAFDVMTGAISRPGSVRAAKIGSDIRAVQSMAKLGGAVLSAMPTDIVGAAQAQMFRGGGFFQGMVSQIDGIMRGRPKGEQAEVSFLLGEGFDSILGEVNSRGLASDGPMGRMSALTDKFFKWNGLNWWTDVGRSVAGRTVAAEMGMRAATGYDNLPANYRHVLRLHGIDASTWDALRAAVRDVEGTKYVTPDMVRDLDDGMIEGLAADRIEVARKSAGADEAQFSERRANILNTQRRELEVTLLRFIADETNYAIVETDAASRRVATLGTRPGTIAGEATRFIMQFKGFPIAFTQRIIGRALFGGRGATKYERLANNAPHIGALLGGMTVAGYMAMTMKDLAKGYWPPRDPTDPKVMTAALIQGGALGIYGDFLFGETSRFGTGPIEALAGPVIGTAGELMNLYTAAREGNPKAGDFLNIVLGNTPFVNLAYTRPVMDYLFLNSLRNWAKPGAVKRQRDKRRKEYDQTSPMPVDSAIRVDRGLDAAGKAFRDLLR